MDWSQCPKDQGKAFETYARQLRFQALGQACRSKGVGALLLGHHQDDNIETVIMRIAQNSRFAGLAGMGTGSPIPGCIGMYGVAESGSPYLLQRSKERASAPLLRTKNGTREVEEVPWVQRLSPRDYKIATGGIQVCRPLLAYTKENLVSTCRENGVPFVTDKTNFDPALTPRNAIRHIQNTAKLPRALQPESILSLAERAQDLLMKRREASNKLLQKCKIIEFDTRGSWVLVRFPLPSELDDFISEIASIYGENNTSYKWLAKQSELVQSFTLRRITRLLSPRPTSPTRLDSFAQFVDSLFFRDVKSKSQEEEERKVFTVNNVMFQPYTWKSENHNKNAADDAANKSTSTSTTDNNNLWLLTRQPYFAIHPLPSTRYEIPLPGPYTFTTETAQNIQKTSTGWKLWDNRYWIRLSIVPVGESVTSDPFEEEKGEEGPLSPIPINGGPAPDPAGTDAVTDAIAKIPLTVRPLTPADFHLILENLRGKPTAKTKNSDPAVTRRFDLADELYSRLSHIARSNASRYSVPLITLDTGFLEGAKQGGDTGGDATSAAPPGEGETRPNPNEKPIGLPSIGFRLSGPTKQSHDFVFRGWKWSVRWEWMFKQVNLKVLELMGWIDKEDK